MTSVLEIVNHYLRSIEKSSNDQERLLHCLTKLYKLPITVQHLQETGIGRTVNSLRKFDGEVGVTAKALVTKWKTMVAAAESSENDEDEEEDGDNDAHKDDRKSEDEVEEIPEKKPDYIIKIKPREHNQEEPKHKERDHHKSREKDRNKDDNKRREKRHEHKSHSSQSSSERDNKKSSHHHKEKKESTSSSHRSSKKRKDSTSSSNNDDKLVMDIDLKSNKRESSPKKIKTELNNQRNNNEIKLPNHHKSNSDYNKNSNSSNSDHKSSKNENKGKIKPSTSSSSNGKSSNTHRSSSSSHKSKHSEKIKSEKDEDHKKHKSSSSSSSSRSSHKKEKIENENSQRSEKNEKSSSSSSKPIVKEESKKRKLEIDDEIEEKDGIDYTTGASFAEALGMIEPTKSSSKIKKKSIMSPVPSTSSTSSLTNNTSTKKLRPPPPIVPTKSTASLSSTPSLLAPSVKLKPLEPEIVLELPTITTNYKPMPINPALMECIFSQNNKAPKKYMTEEEEFCASISSKTMRTKVYSGAKSTCMMIVPTLHELCIRVLQKNIDALEYTGGVPFDILKPVLERASPEQLFNFEDFNPYLMDDSDLLWEGHCKRKFRGKKRQEMETWREMYIRCQEEQDARLTSLTENIKLSQVASVPVKQTKLAYIDSAVKPPRNVQRKQDQFGTSNKKIATPAARVASLSAVSTNIAKIGDTRLKVARGVRDNAQVQTIFKPRKPPLMAKAMQLLKGRFKR